MKETLFLVINLIFISYLNTWAVTFDTIQTIPKTDQAMQTRLTSDANGDFHLVFLMPSKIVDNQYVNGDMFYTRYQSGSWSRPLKVKSLDSEQIPVHFADIAADRLGNAYIVWVNKNRNIFYFVKVENGEDVSIESFPVRRALRADVVTHDQDMIHVLYRDKQPEENWLLSRSINDPIWTTARKTQPDHAESEGQRQPTIAAGQNGIIYYGYRWMEGGMKDRRLAIQAYNIHSGIWSPILDKPRAVYKPWGPQIYVDMQNEPHMVWGEGYEPKIATLYRAPNGKITKFDKGLGENSWPPDVTVLPSGKVIVLVNEGEDYHKTVLSGKAYYYIKSVEGFSDAIQFDPTSITQGWAQIASSADLIMLLWVADGKIRYRLGTDQK